MSEGPSRDEVGLADRSGPLDREGEEALSSLLPDEPLTFGTRAILRRHVGEAWVLGSPTAPRGAVVRAPWASTEPTVFGSDPAAIVDLLVRVGGWECVNCSRELVGPLIRALEHRFGGPVRVREDLYFALDRAPPRLEHPLVRRLGERDLPLVERAPRSLHPVGFDSLLAALSGGAVAGGVIDDTLVGTVSMSVSSEEHADLAAAVLEPWRKQGIAGAAGSLVTAALRDRGLRPVWSTGPDNVPSRQLARKLGFEQVGERAYLFPPAAERTAIRRPFHEGTIASARE